MTNIVCWIASCLFFVCMLALFPSGASLSCAVIVALLLPPLKDIRKEFLTAKKYVAALIIAVILMLVAAPKEAAQTTSVSDQPTKIAEVSKSESVSCEEHNVATTAPTPITTEALEEYSLSIITPVPSTTPEAILIQITESPEMQQAVSSTLAVHFIDVGQADAILLQCGGHTMLVDGGNKADGSLIVSYLKKQDVSHIDFVINTHPHEDHVGGLAGVMAAFQVDNAYSCTEDYDSDAFQDYKKYTEKAGLVIQVPCQGYIWELGDANITLVSTGIVDGGGNNTSLVLRVVHGQNSFLLMGDAEIEEEQSILNSCQDISATVLKVGHHGSDSATGYRLLREVMPQYAVISVGADNAYGHPTDSTLSKLRDCGAEIFRTDIEGNILVTSNGAVIDVQTEQGTSY